MTDKKRVRDILKKIWEGSYSDDCDGIDQCKRDLYYVEDYIAYLEGIEKKYEEDTSLFSAILNKANIDFMNISIEEIDNNDIFYSLMRYEDTGRVVVSKHNPTRYFEGEELKNENETI